MLMTIKVLSLVFSRELGRVYHIIKNDSINSLSE